MSCRCHLCEPWNILAQECADEERLNELQQQRLAVHGLKPAESRKELGHEGPQTHPNILTKRRVEQRDGRVVVIDETYNLSNAGDRERLRRMIADAEKADWPTATWHEKTQPYEQPSFQPHDYSTPFYKAVLDEQEQQRLREYLRSRL